MSITLEQAKSLRYGQTLHFTGRYPCSSTTGPRGGVREQVTRVRVTGNVQTWKRSPERVRVPVKHGLRDSGAVTEYNLQDWHLPEDCPAGISW